jgi:hypothetical protein
MIKAFKVGFLVINPEAERLVSASGLRVSSYFRIQKKILKTRRQLV